MVTHHHCYDGSPAQLQEMRRVIVEPLAETGRPQGWSFALLENWRYTNTEKPREFLVSNAHLWRDETGRLVGFCISNRGDTRANLHSLNDRRDVEADMLTWLEEVWGRDKSELHIGACRHDLGRRELLRRRGFADPQAVTCHYQYDLTQAWPSVDLPEGYHIQSLAEHGKVDGLITLESVVFNATVLDREWYDAKRQAPSYAPGLYIHALAPDGEPVAFAHAWMDSASRLGELDPVGTHPGHRRRRLAAAAIVASFQRMQALGVERVFVATETEPYPANRLYESLGPAVKYYEDCWSKQLR